MQTKVPCGKDSLLQTTPERPIACFDPKRRKQRCVGDHQDDAGIEFVGEYLRFAAQFGEDETDFAAGHHGHAGHQFADDGRRLQPDGYFSEQTHRQQDDQELQLKIDYAIVVIPIPSP